MLWLFLALFSAFFLGLYDVFKKLSLRDNAVFPTLFFVTLTGTLLFIPVIIFSYINPELLKSWHIYVPPISLEFHLLIILKSVIVTASWILSYLALRHLPITIVTPIRATGPLWTLVGAILIFGERLNPLQWLGIATTLSFFYLFSFAGKKEGIHFKSNIWVWCIIGGTLIGAASSLYDKYLLQFIDKMAVQAWFTFYQVFLLIPMVLFYWKPRKQKYPFEWRWSIPWIAVLLIIADFAYFYALSIPESLVSIVSPIRRSGVIVAFLFGALLFKEQNITRKAYLLLGILAGIFIIMIGS